MLIRKYPALFHYIINVDLEKDLNEIIKITKHQDVALLINLIENRANHNFQLRQDLYNLLKGKKCLRVESSARKSSKTNI